MIELRIPAAGDAVLEVQIARWLVPNGAPVTEGQALYEIESDKSVLEVTAPGGGRIEILEPAGRPLPVGHLIARLG